MSSCGQETNSNGLKSMVCPAACRSLEQGCKCQVKVNGLRGQYKPRRAGWTGVLHMPRARAQRAPGVGACGVQLSGAAAPLRGSSQARAAWGRSPGRLHQPWSNEERGSSVSEQKRICKSVEKKSIVVAFLPLWNSIAIIFFIRPFMGKMKLF